jgi:N-acetyl-gamma-glutamyl-phosphate reductase
MAISTLSIGIVGGTGYTGVELLRLLAQHPNAELRVITSRKEAGMPVADMFPNLRGRVTLKFTEPDAKALGRCDVVFFATPNGVAMGEARALLDAGARVIDVAADFRIRDVALWEKWYGMKHACPDLVAEAEYGLPEVNRERIRKARLVANPGCYPTAVQLGFLPLLETGVVDTQHLIADAKSGVSGAGRRAEVHTLLAEASDNFKAYGLAGHRHHPEITQGLMQIAGAPVTLVFVPHLTPMIRGIHATLYARLTAPVDLQTLFEKRYAAEPFVDVMPSGSHPDTRSVRGANFCRIAVHQPAGGDIVVVLSVIDNLVKGAAGQAIQNMNIMFGLPESTGLGQIALLP